jgi:hypothetical protein
LLDPDARKEMRETCNKLSCAVRVTAVLLEGEKDAGDMPREEIWRQIARKIEADCRYSKSALASLKIEELTN